jgi:hypothetical protein
MLGIFQAPVEGGPALKYVYNFNWRIAFRKAVGESGCRYALSYAPVFDVASGLLRFRIWKK